ncbi:MAG: glutathione S-transferase family protein [Symploca sp. SIO2E9]|nr:glutathione S-transferase family protein [Symploca sp. SIO2E9]
MNNYCNVKTFFLGDEFSLADVAVGSILAFFSMILDLDLSEYPAVVDYVKRISERPAFQKTIGGKT